MTTASEWLKSDYRPGRAGHPEEWRTEAVRQVVFLGLSERQVAKNMGVSNKTVSRWVREDSAEALRDLRALGLVQKRPDAAERERVRELFYGDDSDMADADSPTSRIAELSRE